MDFFKEFISQYGVTILYAVLTALAGYLGIIAKRLFTRWVNTKEKKEIVRECVKFTEQVYKTLHGEEKLNEAMKAASEMLSEKGIPITELELRVLIEAALAEFNFAFEKNEADGVCVDGFVSDEVEPISAEVSI